MKTKAMSVIFLKDEGRPMYRNDQDHRTLLCNSKAHALRVISWLGLTGVEVREATEEEEANGYIDTACANRGR